MSFEWIQSYRKKNDQLHFDIVAPHFTIVFATNLLSEKVFIEEVITLTKSISQIEFEITGAIIHKDAFSDQFHEFLIPAKGNTEIIELHDQLYSRKLLQELRTDIEYIPHIGIGNSKNLNECKVRINNLQVPLIRGIISKLSIVRYVDNTISKIAEIELQ